MLLAIFGFMACVFYVFVLIQWVRDAMRAKTIVSVAEGRATESRRQARARVVGSGRIQSEAAPPLSLHWFPTQLSVTSRLADLRGAHWSGALMKRLQDHCGRKGSRCGFPRRRSAQSLVT